jgi:hypothetical protein
MGEMDDIICCGIHSCILYGIRNMAKKKKTKKNKEAPDTPFPMGQAPARLSTYQDRPFPSLSAADWAPANAAPGPLRANLFILGII